MKELKDLPRGINKRKCIAIRNRDLPKTMMDLENKYIAH